MISTPGTTYYCTSHHHVLRTMSITSKSHFYSIVIAVHPSAEELTADEAQDWRLGEIKVDWVDFTREKTIDQDQPLRMPPQITDTAGRKKGSRSVPVPGSSSTSSTSKPERKKKPSDPDALSLQPLLAHFPGPNPLDSSVAQGTSQVGRGVVHLFRHAPPAHLIASLESHPVGEGSGSSASGKGKDEWSGDRAEGEDGSLIAILAVPAWMRPADFLEFIGGWSTCLEGVRMIRCVKSGILDDVTDSKGRRQRLIDQSFCSNSEIHCKLPISSSSLLDDRSRPLILGKHVIPSEFIILSFINSIRHPNHLPPWPYPLSHLHITHHE
jgi:hypothetical protein